MTKCYVIYDVSFKDFIAPNDMLTKSTMIAQPFQFKDGQVDTSALKYYCEKLKSPCIPLDAWVSLTRVDASGYPWKMPTSVPQA